MTTQPENRTETITAHTDPEGQTPWAMQIVVQVEKATPPTRTRAIAAVATAVAQMLSEPAAAPGGPWHPAIERWTDGRIRKHVRRARGAAWQRASAVQPGHTTVVDGVHVHVLVPGPLDDIPVPVAKLQMTGTELCTVDDVDRVTGATGALAVSISARPALSFGKAAAAAAHAAQIALADLEPATVERWRAAGFPVRVEHPDVEQWDLLVKDSPVRIGDAGLTEVEPGTTTAVARWL